MPQVFGVPTVTDGIGMGTEGMKYSLVSREVIADAIETSVNGQCMDGVLVVGGCDKNMPGGMMAMARMNVPAHLRLRRHDQAGQVEGPGAHHRVARSRRWARSPPARWRRKTSTASRSNACPIGGRVRRHVHREHDVVVVRGARHEPPRARRRWPRPMPRRRTPRRESARVLVEAIKSDLKPRDIITRKSIENAIALVMATGGSTNAVLHYLAIASAAEVEWTIDDFERMRREGAGAVRPQALGPVRRGRLPSRRRRAAGAEDAARARACCTATA